MHLAFAAKVHGAKHLRSIFAPLDFLILYSSAAATFGSAGQASYAAANAASHALAQNWAQSRENVLSIQWGAWAEGGMATRHGAVKRAEAAGFGSISNDLGQAILELLLVSKKYGTVCVSPIDWNRLSLDIKLISSFRTKHVVTANTNEAVSQGKYNNADLLTIIRRTAEEAIGHSVVDDAPLMANGLDSLGAVVLAQALSQKLGLSLGSVFALNYPTIEEMAKALLSHLKIPKSLLSNLPPPLLHVQKSRLQ